MRCVGEIFCSYMIAWGTVPIGDKDVANKAMPKLNDCLKKARKTAK